MMLTYFLFLKFVFTSQKLLSRNEKYGTEYLESEGITGNYEFDQYVQSRTIPATYFTAFSVGGAKDNYPLSNLFDDNANTFWSSQLPNTDTFHNTLYINFTAKVTLEAILYDTSYSTDGETRRFDGFPTTFNIYAATDDGPYELKATFTGNPVYPMQRIEFVFQTPITCDQLQLEFAEVTPDGSFSNFALNANSGGIYFLGDILTNRAGFFKSSHIYANNRQYINLNKVPASSFTAFATGGQKDDKPLSNLFDDNKDTYWSSKDPNTDTFRNSLIINFTNTVTIDSILYDTAFSTSGQTRRFNGFPTILNIYTSTNNKRFRLHTTFTGNPVYPMSQILFKFSEPITCDQMQLEFYEVTPDMSFSYGANNPTSGGLTFFKYNSSLPIQGTTNNYANNEYVQSKIIKSTYFTAFSTGGSKNNYPLSNLFDSKANTYWNSQLPNTDTFHNTLYINFTAKVTLEAILYDTAYSTKGETRRFDGFPTTFNIYAATDDGPYELKATFTGNPVYPMQRIEFVFQTPITCDQLQLEFAEVTPDGSFSNFALNANSGGIYFLGDILTNRVGIASPTGNFFNNVNAVNFYKVPASSFTAFATGGQKDDKPLSNLFDDNKDTYWSSKDPNTDTFRNSLIINFTNTVTIDSILYDTAYSTSGQTRRFDGFPTILNIYTSTNNKRFRLHTTFTGNPAYPMSQILFKFSEPITCDQMQLEFYEVTPNVFFADGANNPCSGGLLFIKYEKQIETIKPLLLVSGINESPIYATITKNDLYPECPSDVNRLLLTSAKTSNSNFFTNNPKCLAKLLQVQLNTNTGKVEQLPEILTDSTTFMDFSEIPSLRNIAFSALHSGYKNSDTLFSIGYNYFLHPVTSFPVYDQLKSKIEEIYQKNNQKIVFLSRNQGSSFVSIFISNYSDPEWVKKYIDSVIFISPTFAGTTSFSNLFYQFYPPFQECDELKTTIMRMPGLHIKLPNYAVFNDYPVLYNLNKDFDQHNGEFVFPFLKFYDRADDEAELIFKADVEKYLKVPIPEPPVPSLIIYNDNIDTEDGFIIYQHQYHVVQNIAKNGDGVVISKGSEYACTNWKTSKCLNLHDSTTNSEIPSNLKSIMSIIDFISSNKTKDNEEPRNALFFTSDFEKSSLYATITDPSKASMCPSNLKKFTLLSITNPDSWKIIDDNNKEYWLSDECIAMLIRTNLDESEQSIAFAPGVKLSIPKIGYYYKMHDFEEIIKEAIEKGHNIYKDIFDVSYNYIHYPFMADQVYDDLKKHIENYFIETGMKSFIIGHGEGASFVENFITNHVSSLWAKKFVDGIIFYAPSFAGSGAYDRLVTGNYGSGFPDSNDEMKKSTQRMPGLHVMMPNEEVYGEKVVIKNYPNEGDQSNSTFSASLLKQLGKMDETAYKIFQLTDKYRKSPLKEPPVPSLVIYNDFIETEDGYIFDSATNNVSKIYGKGDGTISNIGPVYACKNWKRATCYNFNQSDVTHDNIPKNKVTIEKTFEFIEKVKTWKNPSPCLLPTPIPPPPETPKQTITATPPQSLTPIPPQSPTPHPSHTPAAPIPDLPSDLTGEITLTGSNCSLEHRCEAIVTGENYVLVQIKVTDFSNYWNPSNGGAIHLINTGINCSEASFNTCSSTAGGGGGIFILNDLEIDNIINLTSIQFNKCSAVYGGSIYIYSRYTPAYIQNCTFKYSTLIPFSETNSNEGIFIDGSAIFSTVMSGSYTNLDFDECQSTAVKFYNNFDLKPSDDRIKTQITENSLLSISNCRFKNGLNSKSAIYYLTDLKGTSFEVKDCIFTGHLNKDSHYIEGKIISKDAPKMKVISCKFSSNSIRAFNINSNNRFLLVDLNDQEFTKETIYNGNLIVIVSTVTLLCLLLTIILVRKRNTTKAYSDEELIL
ncbi:hypothetical protein M9Y10_026339 [Tritrichomonas musculus]|uniref:F5/8 type C domain-containing protein n=1 Tax=Tritrichomonas musculus TaxID=1915356 RepID=A0ABR2H8N4_9EUKA